MISYIVSFSGGRSLDKDHPDYVPNSNMPVTTHEDSKNNNKTTLTISTRKSLIPSVTTLKLHLGRYTKENIPPPAPVECPGIGTQTEVFVKKILVNCGTQTEITMFTNPSVQEHFDAITVMNQNLQKCLAVESEKVNIISAQLNSLKHQLEALEIEINNYKYRSITFESLQGGDKANFYTGLPLASLNVVVNYLLERDGQHPDDVTKKNEICLVLAKLRLNLLHQDLAFRSGLSLGHISKRFHHWLNVMYVNLGGLVIWPPDDMPMQLPPVFQNRFLRKVKCVLDCFEIVIERPESLKARAQTYSQYKSRNTAKVLLGISPSGAVTFVSKAWGGRASDKLITNESGVLDKLQIGDSLLVDRGFLIKDECLVRGINLISPAFTRGKKQLPRREVEMSRLISRARIHIERVINKCRDYRILKGPIPISLLKQRSDTKGTTITLDKIIHVSCSLTNLKKPVLSS